MRQLQLVVHAPVRPSQCVLCTLCYLLFLKQHLTQVVLSVHQATQLELAGLHDAACPCVGLVAARTAAGELLQQGPQRVAMHVHGTPSSMSLLVLKHLSAYCVNAILEATYIVLSND